MSLGSRGRDCGLKRIHTLYAVPGMHREQATKGLGLRLGFWDARSP
jgi:hypothetical protein